jgi:hypothetical protein
MFTVRLLPGASKMDRAIAEKMIETLLNIDDPLNAATELTSQMADEAEARSVRRGLAEILVRIDDVMRPIVRQFPDLDPLKNETYGR